MYLQLYLYYAIEDNVVSELGIAESILELCSSTSLLFRLKLGSLVYDSFKTNVSVALIPDYSGVSESTDGKSGECFSRRHLICSIDRRKQCALIVNSMQCKCNRIQTFAIARLRNKWHFMGAKKRQKKIMTKSEFPMFSSYRYYYYYYHHHSLIIW